MPVMCAATPFFSLCASLFPRRTRDFLKPYERTKKWKTVSQAYPGLSPVRDMRRQTRQKKNGRLSDRFQPDRDLSSRLMIRLKSSTIRIGSVCSEAWFILFRRYLTAAQGLDQVYMLHLYSILHSALCLLFIQVSSSDIALLISPNTFLQYPDLRQLSCLIFFKHYLIIFLQMVKFPAASEVIPIKADLLTAAICRNNAAQVFFGDLLNCAA